MRSFLTSIFVLISVAALGGSMVGCTQSNPQTHASSPSPTSQPIASTNPLKTTHPSADSSAWIDLIPGETIRDLSFTQTGTLSYQGKTLLAQIPVSGSSDGTTTYAKRLIVSPTSPSGRYTILKACETATEDGLCWAIYKVDRAEKTVQNTNIGKYGGLNWVRWSSDDRYAIFLEKMEGTAWFVVMDLKTGASKISNELPAQPQLNRFTWTGDRTFTVPLANGSTFQGDITAIAPDA